ncbi:MAG: AraC family transcriptional regulator [Colwellia sp.]|nr:AraC family transcriptional regulator [Colwellia sp.]
MTIEIYTYLYYFGERYTTLAFGKLDNHSLSINMTPDIIQHFYMVGTASSVMVACLMAVVILRASRTSHKELAFIFIALLLSVIANSLLHKFKLNYQISILGLPEPFQLIIGPVLYLYLSKLNLVALTTFVKLLHVIPFLLVTLFIAWLVSSTGNDAIYSSEIRDLANALSMGIYIQLWVYYLLCHRQSRKFTEKLKHSCSSLEKVNKSWIEQILLILLIGYSGVTLLYLSNHASFYLPVNKSLTIILASIIYLMVYKTLRRPELYSAISGQRTNVPPARVPVDSISESVASNTKYQKSGLGQQEATETYAQIQKYMMLHKPFVEPELSLHLLADKIGLSSHHLSQVINHSESTNFYDFINSYRVDEVKQQLLKAENASRSVLSIAFDAGFNSKATFNRIFKERTQQTPTQYRKGN